MAEEPQGRASRSKRLSVALTPEMYDKVQEVAAQVGLSANAWAAYTIGQAARSQEALRNRMADETAAVLARVVSEMGDDGTA